MFIVANLISALASVIGAFLTLLYWMILIRAVMSWVSPDPFNPIVQFLTNTTDPILEPIRRMLPASWRAGIDISPIIAFFLLMFMRAFIVGTLIDLSLRLK